MTPRSKFDPNQIFQFAFDEASESIKTKLVDTEMAIELNHNDGDSVSTHPAKLIVSAIGCNAEDNETEVVPPLDCSSLREIRVDIDGTGSVKVMVSPTDSGDFFYPIGGEGETHKVCARRVKVKSVNAVGDVHLVGRS